MHRRTCPRCRGGWVEPIRTCPVCGGYGIVMIDGLVMRQAGPGRPIIGRLHDVYLPDDVVSDEAADR